MTNNIISESLSLEELDLLNDLQFENYIVLGNWDAANIGDIQFTNYIFNRLEDIDIIEADYFNEWSKISEQVYNLLKQYKEEYKDKPNYKKWENGYKELEFFDIAYRLTSIGKLLLQDKKFHAESFKNMLKNYSK